MLDKQIAKKIEFKELLSKINKEYVEPFDNLDKDIREYIINYVISSCDEINNYRKYLSLYRHKQKVATNKGVELFRIGAYFLIIAILSHLFKVMFQNQISIELSANLKTLLFTFTPMGLFFFFLSALNHNFFSDEEKDRRLNEHAENSFPIEIELRKKILENNVKVSMIEVIYEIFKSRDEVENEELRSIILHEIIKERYVEVAEASENNKNYYSEKELLFQGSSEENISLISLEDLIGSPLNFLTRDRKFFYKVLKNVDNRLSEEMFFKYS